MAQLSIKDVVRCPTCGGRDIVYTCEPKCCFNHLCSECRTTFQLLTRKASHAVAPVQVQAEEPPSGDPAAACAACDSLKLQVVADGESPVLVCSNCSMTLELAYDEIAPDVS